MPKTKHLAKGYHQLTDGTIVRLPYKDNGYGQTVTARSLTEAPKTIPRSEFEGSKFLPKYRPSITELHRLALTIKTAECKKLNYRLGPPQAKFFLAKLVEFGHARINRLGFFFSDKWAKETYADHLAEGLAMMLSATLSFQKGNPARALHIKAWDAWIANPTERNRKTAFPELITSTIDRECPISGHRFEWGFDGTRFQPIFRCLTSSEKDQKEKELKAEFSLLKEKKGLDEKETARLTTLKEIFEKDFGYIRHFYEMQMTEVETFHKMYGYRNVFPPLTLEINVPSGHLIFANTLADHLNKEKVKTLFDDHSSEHNLGHRAGTRYISQYYERELDTLHLQVGNSSPHIFQSRNGTTLRLGRGSDENDRPKWPGWKDRGYIPTQIWAFDAADASTLKPQFKRETHIDVTVPPGRYRLTDYTEKGGHKTGLLCEITRIGGLPPKKSS